MYYTFKELVYLLRGTRDVNKCVALRSLVQQTQTVFICNINFFFFTVRNTVVKNKRNIYWPSTMFPTVFIFLPKISFSALTDGLYVLKKIWFHYLYEKIEIQKGYIICFGSQKINLFKRVCIVNWEFKSNCLKW